ncbi:hypothetical protein B0H13DRAFT_2318869 [Mycena leptocephala]|nr:hypothetical protein B0H13DRAFT_2318869 [Mycena leptocephala]
MAGELEWRQTESTKQWYWFLRCKACSQSLQMTNGGPGSWHTHLRSKAHEYMVHIADLVKSGSRNEAVPSLSWSLPNDDHPIRVPPSALRLLQNDSMAGELEWRPNERASSSAAVQFHGTVTWNAKRTSVWPRLSDPSFDTIDQRADPPQNNGNRTHGQDKDFQIAVVAQSSFDSLSSHSSSLTSSPSYHLVNLGRRGAVPSFPTDDSGVGTSDPTSSRSLRSLNTDILPPYHGPWFWDSVASPESSGLVPVGAVTDVARNLANPNIGHYPDAVIQSPGYGVVFDFWSLDGSMPASADSEKDGGPELGSHEFHSSNLGYNVSWWSYGMPADARPEHEDAYATAPGAGSDSVYSDSGVFSERSSDAFEYNNPGPFPEHDPSHETGVSFPPSIRRVPPSTKDVPNRFQQLENLAKGEIHDEQIMAGAATAILLLSWLEIPGEPAPLPS